MPGGGGNEKCLYRAPALFVGVFYGFLLAWTIVSLYFLWPKALRGGVSVVQLTMIAFVLAYTWYFSLGISYEVQLEDQGKMKIRSLRRVLEIPLGDITAIEGPRFAVLPYGFLRFRLVREKAYVFCQFTSKDLSHLLDVIHRANKKVERKGV
jgi:hypothetical protein